MTINLKVDMNRVTVGDLIAIEEKSMKTMRDIVARFMVDASGQPLPREAAIAELNAMPLPEFTDVARKFASAMQEQSLPAIGDGI